MATQKAGIEDVKPTRLFGAPSERVRQGPAHDRQAALA
jgi:hypothetical protein